MNYFEKFKNDLKENKVFLKDFDLSKIVEDPTDYEAYYNICLFAIGKKPDDLKDVDFKSLGSNNNMGNNASKKYWNLTKLGVFYSKDKKQYLENIVNFENITEFGSKQEIINDFLRK